MAIYLRCYGDLIFAESPQISRGYKNATAGERVKNGLMNKPRTSVEWSFGETDQRFARIAHKSSMKLFQGPSIGAKVINLTILSNCYTCLQGSLTNTFFGSIPPSLEVYLSGGVEPDSL